MCVISPLFATWDTKTLSGVGGGKVQNARGLLETQKGPGTSGRQRPGEKNGGRGLPGGRGKGAAGTLAASGGQGTSEGRRNRCRPKGWGTAGAADRGPRGELGAGFRPYLKSLSLDVIFSSRLEMWYEALAMLTASIPPAGAADAAARCRRRRRCCSSRSRRSRFQGRSATPTLTKEAPRRVAPSPARRGPVPGKAEATRPA